jgi:hypothetical protein
MKAKEANGRSFILLAFNRLCSEGTAAALRHLELTVRFLQLLCPLIFAFVLLFTLN